MFTGVFGYAGRQICGNEISRNGMIAFAREGQLLLERLVIPMMIWRRISSPDPFPISPVTEGMLRIRPAFYRIIAKGSLLNNEKFFTK